ncbi:hypothetical protein [Pedobacter sp. MW01-1-1]|uniref:hypothetical protein n=1 Tax=Pedobacter sp. MW01-1-1 TaxID=3383027 RepID=UPI003FEDC38A
MTRFTTFLILCFGLFGLQSQAQNQPATLATFQDSLNQITKQISKAETDDQKLALNSAFVKKLVEALKTPNSFQYPFDSLKNVSIVKSSDQVFRIISWYLELENSKYRYYGAIQMNTGSKPLKLYPLMDQTDNIKNPNAILSPQNWFGARYYEMIPVQMNGKLPYYVLLGWKGNNALTSKKVIEILSFDRDNTINLGLPVFDGKELKDKNRVIFEYTKTNAMLLKTDVKAGMIVFDHLAPFQSEMVGKYEYYGSDGSFDGFKIIAGRLKLQENIELINDPDEADEMYIDPKLKSTPEKKF